MAKSIGQVAGTHISIGTAEPETSFSDWILGFVGSDEFLTAAGALFVLFLVIRGLLRRLATQTRQEEDPVDEVELAEVVRALRHHRMPGASPEMFGETAPPQGEGEAEPQR